MTIKKIALSSVAVITLCAASTMFASNGGSNNEVRSRTQLAGAAIDGKTPHGQVDFRSEASRARVRLEVEVEDVNLPDQTSLEVDVNGTKAGNISLKLGTGELELESEHGDVVPAIHPGDIITVVGPKGAILAGAF